MTETVLPLDQPAPPAEAESLPRRVLRTLRDFARRAPLSTFWGVIAALIIVMAVAAPVIAPYEPLKSDFRHMTKPPEAPHYFGTDQIGRDTLSRVIYGSRASLTVAIGAVLFGTTLGALWGLASGYFGGRFDIGSQRIIPICIVAQIIQPMSQLLRPIQFVGRFQQSPECVAFDWNLNSDGNQIGVIEGVRLVAGGQ